ncbi:MAG: nitrate reductase, partial [Terriglobia bacterium]
MKLSLALGLDILSEKYAYGHDPEFGYVASEKIPDRWVKTTCGYCSVGCGMLVGVKDGRAVSVRGDAGHPVNLGKLCPKGLSEHYTLEAQDRARYPLLRRKGKLQRIGWDEALDVMVE